MLNWETFSAAIIGCAVYTSLSMYGTKGALIALLIAPLVVGGIYKLIIKSTAKRLVKEAQKRRP